MDGAHCDYGLFVGAAVDNAQILPDLSKQALALKMYLNETFTSLRLDSMETWMEVCHVILWVCQFDKWVCLIYNPWGHVHNLK